MRKRKFLLVGNWKLNHNKQETANFFETCISKLGEIKYVDIAIAPMCLYLDFCQKFTKNTIVKLSAQNCFYEKSGAYTGEYAAQNLAELGVEFCIVGHSERRNILGETDIVIAKKTRACLAANLVPIVCVGESLAEREAGKTEKIIAQQVSTVLEANLEYKSNSLVFAYEPIWAIGTGKTATCEQIQEIHVYIREIITQKFGQDHASKTQILYGGSVKPENIKQISSCSDVDGALAGGASLRVDSFLSMVAELSDLGHAQQNSIG